MRENKRRSKLTNNAAENELAEVEQMLLKLVGKGILDFSQFIRQQGDENTLGDETITLRVRMRILDRLGYPTLGDYIKYRRQKNEISKETAAKFLGVIPSALADLENNRVEFHNLKLEKAIRIAKYFKLSVSVIVGYLRSFHLAGGVPKQTQLLYRSRKYSGNGKLRKSESSSNFEKEQITKFIDDFTKAMETQNRA